MAQEQPRANSRVSRRDFLFVTAAGGGALLCTGLAASPAAAAKMSPRAMQYRPTPNGNQRCDNCANFQAPGACKLVDGAIVPSGWCILYAPKK